METSEQLIADNKYLNDLETKITDWRKELVWIERELTEQAILDVRTGQASNRYKVLETREQDLKRYLREAETRITSISKRYETGPLSNLVNTALNRLRT